MEFLKKHRSELLTCAFVSQMLLAPLADRDPRIGGVLALVLLLLLFVGARHLTNMKIVRRVVIPSAGIWLVARALEAFGNSSHFYAHLAPIAGLGLSCAILWAILDRFESIPMVTASAISQAFISYLVIAIAFSQLYWILNRLIPNMFNQVIPESQTSTLLYFSMITLSGVGYGGIIPMNPYVRMIAAMENMVGIFYIAVIVARLVSSYRPRTHRGDRETDRPS
jgi:Ion channel